MADTTTHDVTTVLTTTLDNIIVVAVIYLSMTLPMITTPREESV